MPGKLFEAACEPIVRDILRNHEGFASIEKGPTFIGTPFGCFGRRDGVPYVKVLDGVYRMLYDEQVTRFFTGHKAPMEPIVEWVKGRMARNGIAVAQYAPSR